MAHVQSFPFHFISADGAPDEVAARVRREFQYQAELDLAPEAYEMMQTVEPASAIVRGARSAMVQRLNRYATEYKALFGEVLAGVIASDIMPLLKRQGLMGKAVIRSNNPLLENPVALNMALDVLAERGYIVTLDVVRSKTPVLVEAQIAGLTTGSAVVSRTEKTYVFLIEFPRPEIRRNE